MARLTEEARKKGLVLDAYLLEMRGRREEPSANIRDHRKGNEGTAATRDCGLTRMQWTTCSAKSVSRPGVTSAALRRSVSFATRDEPLRKATAVKQTHRFATSCRHL